MRKNSIVWPTAQEMFPALFKENSSRNFRSRYQLEAEYGSLLTEEQKAKAKEYEEKDKVTKTEFNLWVGIYEDGIHEIWLKLERDLRAELEAGTIDSFPPEVVSRGHSFRLGKDYITSLSLDYFEIFDRGWSNKWVWAPEWRAIERYFIGCTSFHGIFVSRKEKEAAQKAMPSFYRYLSYLSLWDQVRDKKSYQLKDMKDKFRFAALKLGMPLPMDRFQEKSPEWAFASRQDAFWRDYLGIPREIYQTEKTEEQNLSRLKAGDTFMYGHYSIAGDGAVFPIKWRVLENNQEELLAISQYCLEQMPFDDSEEEGLRNLYHHWDGSSLRLFLNGEFLEEAFDQKERARILKNEICFTDQEGKEHRSEDQVFLLSRTQVIKYFIDKMEAPATKGTPWAQNTKKGGKWWLISHEDREAADICNDSVGESGYLGSNSRNCALGIRPVIRLRIEG